MTGTGNKLGRNFPALVSVLLVVVVTFVCSRAQAAEEYLVTPVSPSYGGTIVSCSDVASCEQEVTDGKHSPCGTDPADVSGQYIAGPYVDGAYWTISIKLQCEPGGGNAGTAYFKAPNTSCPGGEAPPCAVSCDDSITGTAFLRPVFSGGSTGDICHESSNCVMTATNVIGLASDDLVEYVGTGDDCAAEDVVDVDAGDQESQCITSGGDTFCTEPNLADQNCGYLNDDYLCLSSVPDGDCTFYGNGDMACSTTATSPPAPDDGVTPGTPATPDGIIEINGDTINIYDNSSVVGSSGGTSGTNQGDAPAESLEVDLDFSDIIETEPDSGSFDDDIATDETSMADDVQGLIDDLTDPDDFGQTTSLGSDLATGLGYNACADVVVSAAGRSLTFACADAAIIRDWLGWAMRLVFLLAMFQLITQRPK